MAIVSESYYTDTYIGQAVATADFPRFDAAAERAIGLVTRGQVTADTLSDYSTDIQTAYKNAICAQIEYYAYFGIRLSSSGRQSQSYTVGKVSVNTGSERVGARSMICPQAYALLEQTGLLNPQVNTRGEPFLPFWFGGGWNA